jgi:hypothetical protein
MYKKRLLYLILISAAVRILVASVLELGNDEVYYYTYALHLQPNYFDHPPAVAWLIRIFTGNLLLQQEVFMRLGSIVFAAIGTWLCFVIGNRIRNEATGWYAALLYTTSIYCSVIAGTFILPDSPQIVFWLASLLAAIKLVDAYRLHTKATYTQWLLFGLLSGVCIMCKVHGVFLWMGLGLYMLFYNRRMFLHPGFYIAVVVTAIIASPILTWNIHNNFITWRYHSERVEVHQFALNTDGFIQAVLGQIFYNNPFNVCILVFALFAARKTKLFSSDVNRLLLFTGVPMIAFVTGISLLRDVLPHWSGPGFLTLSFIAAAFLAEKLSNKIKSLFSFLLKASIGLMIVLITGGIALIELYPGTLGSKNTANLGDGDCTLDLYGWQQFGKDFTAWEKDAEAKNEITPGLNIVCNKWFPAAHILYYVASQSGNNVVGVGDMNDLHQFVWLNHYQPAISVRQDALCIIPSNYHTDVQQAYGSYFDSILPLHQFVSFRGNKVVRYFNVYLLKGYKGNDEARTVKVE